MPRRIVTVRHGERVDFTFSDDWIRNCFNEQGVYSRQNLNQPDGIPARAGSPQTFIGDTPLTQVGNMQARLVGSGLKSEQVLREGFEVLVSPSLRCVQTATAILKGMGVNAPLKIEPCLFEWTQWYSGHMPYWMTKEEFKSNGFNIDDKYQSFANLEDLREGESIETYYNRSFQLMQYLISKYGDKDLLLVAHGSSLDTNSRQLMGFSIRSEQQMLAVLRGIPYCAVAVMEEDDRLKKWSFGYFPRLQLTHQAVHDFDARKNLCVLGEHSIAPPFGMNMFPIRG